MQKILVALAQTPPAMLAASVSVVQLKCFFVDCNEAKDSQHACDLVFAIDGKEA